MFVFYYMDSETIWTSILIPIVIAPISWILSKWYQNTQQLKYERDKELYTLQKVEYEQCLNLFLYPVYFKLLLIYQLDFNVPDDFNYTEESTDSSDSSSDPEDTVEKVRCIGYYKRESGQLYKCRQQIPVNDISKVCKKCRWKYSKEKIKLRLDLGSSMPEINRSRTESYMRVQMPTDLPESSVIELNDHKIDRRLSKMKYLQKCINEESIQQLNRVIIEHYREVKTIIENNIHIIKPTVRERNVYVNLIRFIEIKTILGCSDREIEHDYGYKKNLVTVLSLVTDTLYRVNESYSSLILNPKN